MLPGQCFTIEVYISLAFLVELLLTIPQPALIQGRDPKGWIFPDGWTASTEVCRHSILTFQLAHVVSRQNCARSAQAEHTVLITNESVDVLTR